MHRNTLTTGLLLAGGALGLSTPALADFIKDSKASLELRNFYFNRDFRQANAPQSKAEEWAQGFLLRYESGFTAGSLGVGVDAIGLLAPPGARGAPYGRALFTELTPRAEGDGRACHAHRLWNRRPWAAEAHCP